ncbi:hypothetical protein ACCO45_002676 [Purpureocillium lilacinum]|uniref:Uncharacterized protein n=1 Tax=Purpureocillium lilacinum TaxID=33203 RepID=A0ACC4EBM5_PURLI
MRIARIQAQDARRPGASPTAPSVLLRPLQDRPPDHLNATEGGQWPSSPAAAALGAWPGLPGQNLGIARPGWTLTSPTPTSTLPEPGSPRRRRNTANHTRDAALWSPGCAGSLGSRPTAAPHGPGSVPAKRGSYRGCLPAEQVPVLAVRSARSHCLPIAPLLDAEASKRHRQSPQYGPRPRCSDSRPLPHSPELPSSRDRRRSDLNQQFSHLMDNLQSRVLTASHTLNDITGYSSIEGIKAENEALEVQLADAQSRVRSARQAYKTSNTKRATTQREVTTLLARKDSWSPHDLERFTELYRADHVLEGEVASAQESLTEAEADEQKLSQRLNAGILKRYHEEQIWSDRIRRASTWGTWGLMGMNFVLFVVLQFVAEPWRRRRLVKGVVAEEKAVLEEVRNELEAVKLGLAKKDEEQVRQREQELAVEQSATLAAEQEVSDAQGMGPEGTWREILLDPGRWQTAVQDLGSERRIGLRMRDASVLVLEAALAGAAIAGSIALLLARGSIGGIALQASEMTLLCIIRHGQSTVTMGAASTEDGDGEAQLVNGHAPSRPVRHPVRQRLTRGRHVEKCRVYGGSSLGSAMLLRHREAAHVRPASGLGAQVNQSDAAGGSWAASASATAVLREGGTASP